MSASSPAPKRKPTLRTRSDCCASAASGQAAATPPRRVMTSRRRIATPETEERAIVTIKSIAPEGVIDVRFGSLVTASNQRHPSHVRFAPRAEVNQSSQNLSVVVASTLNLMPASNSKIARAFLVGSLNLIDRSPALVFPKLGKDLC